MDTETGLRCVRSSFRYRDDGNCRTSGRCARVYSPRRTRWGPWGAGTRRASEMGRIRRWCSTGRIPTAPPL